MNSLTHFILFLTSYRQNSSAKKPTLKEKKRTSASRARTCMCLYIYIHFFYGPLNPSAKSGTTHRWNSEQKKIKTTNKAAAIDKPLNSQLPLRAWVSLKNGETLRRWRDFRVRSREEKKEYIYIIRYPEAYGAVAVDVERLEHIVGVDAGVCGKQKWSFVQSACVACAICFWKWEFPRSSKN